MKHIYIVKTTLGIFLFSHFPILYYTYELRRVSPHKIIYLIIVT